jgi:hypothetical protein
MVAPLIGLVLLFMLSTAVLFQSTYKTGQLFTTAGMHFIPPDNYLLPNTEIGNPVFSSNIITTSAGEKPVKTQPTAGKKDKINIGPVCKPEPKIEETIETQPELNFAKPITVTENDAARQIIVTEEGSGTASVKVYYLSFEDGKWILQPEWVMTAKEIKADSLHEKIDSLQSKLKKIYPDQQ